ncbi:TIGR02186 family protein, partial [Rhizobium ruizarguesonis]
MRLAVFVIALFCLLPAYAGAQWLPGQATEAVREGLEIGTST